MMKQLKCVQIFLAILPLLFISACSSGAGNDSSNPPAPPPQQSGSIFTVATDAPLPSIVSCQLNVTGITVNNGTTDVSVLSQAELVDFAQLSGLHQLVDLTAVPTGTYVSATVTIANPVIGFIDTTQSPPAINTINGTLSTNTATVTFAQPFTVNNGDLDGLRMEFDLRKSLAVDSNGQVTGTINPMFQLALRNATDSEVSIDDFAAGVVGVTGANTFTVQGPHGRQWNVTTDDNTILDDPTEPINSFTSTTIVSLTGQLDPVSHAIDATEVNVISNDGFYFGGLLTSVNPPTGPATLADLYVRDELPAVNGISPGDIASLSLNGTEKYRIGHIKLPLTSLPVCVSSKLTTKTIGYAFFGGALTLLLLQFRQWPLPYALAGQSWLLKLHAKESGIPYGIALAVGALMIYPETEWIRAVDLTRLMIG